MRERKGFYHKKLKHIGFSYKSSIASGSLELDINLKLNPKTLLFLLLPISQTRLLLSQPDNCYYVLFKLLLRSGVTNRRKTQHSFFILYY